MTDITTAMTDGAIEAELGLRIKHKRIARNLKQSDMANTLGVSIPTYNKLEKGEGKLSIFIATLRVFNELEALNTLLKVANLSPMDQLKKAPPQRKRASTKLKSVNAKLTLKWGIRKDNGK